MTKVLENEEFNSIHIDEGGVFNSLRFEKCLFQSCSILSRKLNDNSDLPPRFENILIKDCTALNCVSGPAFLKDVTVENLRTGDIFLIYSTMFHHVTLKGKLGAIKINKKDENSEIYDYPISTSLFYRVEHDSFGLRTAATRLPNRHTGICCYYY